MNRDDRVIYVVTTIENLSNYPLLYHHSDPMDKTFTRKEIQENRGEIQRSRTVGYYFDLDKAIECVEGNWNDIYEGSDKHAVIEATHQGVYPIPDGVNGENETWFEWQGSWDDGGYKRIDKPECAKTAICWGIG